MNIVRDPLEFQALCSAQQRSGAGLGLVPTMGALHAGHIALVRASRQRDPITAVSVFVNPTQFGPHEDLARYPRPFERDAEMLRSEGVQLLFAPGTGALYPPGEATRVEVEGLSQRLDGASRPGHFRGVATVVLKLLLLAAPARAYFGQKDAAQIAVLRRMLRDLFVPTEFIVCPIVREPDGLALSSRNAYLSPEERKSAPSLYGALNEVQARYRGGETDSARLLAHGRELLVAVPGLKLDYFELVNADTLLPVAAAQTGNLLAVAAWFGTTRLIDNLLL